MTPEEIVQEIKRFDFEIKAKKQELKDLTIRLDQVRVFCPHPPEYSKPRGLGRTCKLCGRHEYPIQTG